ncbi:MAG: PAS domain S-box protein [Opitutae bacterium]|nr:PAS domain S-box protein [Opitutae bacterium]
MPGRQLQMLNAIAAAANAATSVDSALQTTVDELCRHLGWPVGHAYLQQESTPPFLASARIWHLDDAARFASFRAESEQISFTAGVGMPGRVWQAHQPVWLGDLSADNNFLRSACAREAGLHAGFAFPVLTGGQVTAVLEFFAPVRTPPDEAMLELCSQIGAMLGRVFERQRLEHNLSELNRDLERRVAQRTIELTESRAALQDFLDNANDLIQSVDMEGRYRFVNRAWCETLGYTQEEAAALSMFDVIDPAWHEHCQTLFKELLKTARPLRMETVFRTKDGRPVQVEGNINLRHEAGRPDVTRGVFRDITQRKQTEQALQVSQARWKLAVTASKDGIWDWDMVGRQVYVSPQAKALIGYADDELRNGMDVWSELVHPEDRPRLARALKRHLRRETPVFECEHRMRAKDGGYRWILARGAALFDDRGRPQRMLGAFIDVTPRRLAEEQMIANLAREKELGEMKTRFVAMASHELRTPLATFSLAVDFFRQHWSRLQPVQVEENLQTIAAGVQQLRHVLDHLLLAGQDDEGQMRCHPAPLELTGFCRQLADEVKATHRAPHLIEWVFSRREWVVRLDPRLLRHILTNLLGNACKYSPGGGSVRCGVAEASGGIVLTVADEGIGIPPEDQLRLFDFFFRAGNVGGIPGTGLGLLVVQRCVAAHGGRIEFTSTPGAGTCFTVCLPQAQG